jgi:spore coat protein CotH
MSSLFPRFTAAFVLVVSAAPALGDPATAPTTAVDEFSVDRLFERDRLLIIEIELPDSEWAQLCKQTRDFATAFSDPTQKPFTYFKGNISIDGVRIESVGIRKKGFFGSLDDVRPSLKINFDEYVELAPIKGLDALTLNNNKQDGSLVSQLLTYRLFDAAGLHAPRCNFARVTVNGKFLGIYSNVESIDRPFLKRRFGDNSGTLFEGTIADFYPRSLDRLELKSKENDRSRTRSRRLAELLASSDPLALDEIEQLVDLDYFLKFWAVESLIGFWDGYSSNQNNYWVYENPKNGKFYFMPWGADASFTGVRPPFGFSNAQKATSIYAESMLANRLYHTDGVAHRYRATMLNLLDTVWKEDELLATIDWAEQFVAGQLHQRQSWMPGAVKNMRNFIGKRRETILKEFEEWPVAVPATPRKPMYTVDVGSARGTFTTDWQEKPPANLAETGTAEVHLKLDGERVEFTKLGVQGGPSRMPFAGPFGGAEPRAGIVFTGIRASDSQTITLNLWTDRKAFARRADEGEIAVQGMVVVGKAGFNPFNPSATRSIAGVAKLAKSGTTDGDSVAGEIDVKIVETRGGFFVGRGELATPKSGSRKGTP